MSAFVHIPIVLYPINGEINRMASEARTEDKDTYLEILSVNKKTTTAIIPAYIFVIKAYPIATETAFPPLNPANIG